MLTILKSSSSASGRTGGRVAVKRSVPEMVVRSGDKQYIYIKPYFERIVE